MTATSQAVGVATSLSSDFQDDPYDGLVGMAYGSISTMGVTPLFQTLVSQGRVAKSQFSTYLASSGSELFLGGMNSAHFAAGSTHWYSVISQGYWTLAAKAAVNNKVVSSLGTFSALVDTGTSVIVVSTIRLVHPSPGALLTDGIFASLQPGSDGGRQAVLGCGPQLGHVRLRRLLDLPLREPSDHLVLLRRRLCRAVGRLVERAQLGPRELGIGPLRGRGRRRRHWHQRLDPRRLVPPERLHDVRFLDEPDRLLRPLVTREVSSPFPFPLDFTARRFNVVASYRFRVVFPFRDLAQIIFTSDLFCRASATRGSELRASSVTADASGGLAERTLGKL